MLLLLLSLWVASVDGPRDAQREGEPSPSPPPSTPAAAAAAQHDFDVAAVPTLTFNTDEGFGTGGVASLYHRYGGVAPYRDALTLNVFISSKLVQAHALTVDAIQPFDLPARVYIRVGYYSTVSQNYCGVGNSVTCADGDAVAAAGRLRLTRAERDDVIRHYHLMRFIRPHATVIGRLWLRDKPYRTELLLGWRGSYTLPGELFERGPYPHSLYQRDFPSGEQGLSSAPLVGIVVDNRDAEVFATRGFVAEASVRAAHPWLGSTWTWAGINVSHASFFELLAQPRVVLAQRLLFDVVIGEPSIEELARIGGTLEPIAFGGAYLGRGIREHRYLGKLKAISQTELRAQLFEHTVWDQHLSHGAALFSDVGWIGYDVTNVRGNPLKLLGTLGVSYRLIWNHNFAIRWDLATSPNEQQGPGFYIIVGQVF